MLLACYNPFLYARINNLFQKDFVKFSQSLRFNYKSYGGTAQRKFGVERHSDAKGNQCGKNKTKIEENI